MSQYFAGQVASDPEEPQSYVRTGLAGETYVGDMKQDTSTGEESHAYAGETTLTYNGTQYDCLGFVAEDPVIIDIDGIGRPDVDRGQWLPHPERFNLGKATMFDIDGDGEEELTEWLGPHSGLLVEPDAKGKVNDAMQLFANAIGYTDGCQKLSILRDKKHNGILSGNELNGLKVWIDKNRDGKCQPEELFTLAELGITSINLKQNNMEMSCVMNGRTHKVWDWWPTAMVVRQSAEPGKNTIQVGLRK